MGPAIRSRPMRHIDRKDLYTNLEARIQYLHTFLDFGSNDIEALESCARYVKQLIPALVNIVYHKLLQYDITARAFATRSTSYEGPVDPGLHDNSPQIMHRKMFLQAYLTKLCSDPSTMEFWYYLDKVGMMHVGRGREHPLHIEYVHIGACLAFIQDTLTEALLSHPRLPMARKIAFVKALGKVIWIQNDLFAKWYVRDGDEFADEMEQHTRLYEREGYLNGRKVLDGVDEDGGGEDGGSEGEGEAASLKMPTPPAACPFSGVPIRHKAQTPTGEKGAPPSPPTSVSVPEISVAEV